MLARSVGLLWVVEGEVLLYILRIGFFVMYCTEVVRKGLKFVTLGGFIVSPHLPFRPRRYWRGALYESLVDVHVKGLE